MLIIGLSGKIGVGKTAIADKLVGLFEQGRRVSFADALKKEAAEIYGFDHELTKTADGKNTMVCSDLLPGESASVRQILIHHGRKRRDEDPYYWTDRMNDTLRELYDYGCDAAVIDDVRFPDEVDFLLKFGAGSLLVRIEPYRGWKPGPHAQDESETALDCAPQSWPDRRFDLTIRPSFGKNGLNEAVRIISRYIVIPPMREEVAS